METADTFEIVEHVPLPAPKKGLEPIRLRTAHDFNIVTTALDSHAEVLKKLATKNEEAGYHREAGVISADVQAIEHAIVPQFRSQRELPLVTMEQLTQAVEEAVRRLVYPAFNRLDDPKSSATAKQIRDTLIKQLRDRITLYAADVAKEAYDHGYQARTLSPEMLAQRSIATLNGTGGE